MSEVAQLGKILSDKKPESFSAEMQKELGYEFEKIVTGDRPVLAGMEELPEWFLLKELPEKWSKIQHPEVVLTHLKKVFEKSGNIDFQIQLAYMLSKVDARSSMQLLVAFTQKRNSDKKSKQKYLTGKQADIFIKYFISKDNALSLERLLSHPLDTNVMKIFLQIIFEIIFVNKKFPSEVNKHSLQYKVLHSIIENELYASCEEKYPGAITEKILQWPIHMVKDLHKLTTHAAARGIKMNIPDSLQTSVDDPGTAKDIRETQLEHMSPEDLLTVLGKKIASLNVAFSEAQNTIQKDVLAVAHLQKYTQQLGQEKERFARENRQLSVDKENMIIRHQRQLQDLHGQMAVLQNKLESLMQEKDSLAIAAKQAQENFKNDKLQLSKRIEVEVGRAKKCLLEEISDKLKMEFDDSNYLGDDEKHRVAKIMTKQIFEKLMQLGVRFNNQ